MNEAISRFGIVSFNNDEFHSQQVIILLIKKITEHFKSGVIRTNCMDCLDRTNAVQTLIGKLMPE